MYKVLSSYSRKAEQKHEVSGGGHSTMERSHGGGGTLGRSQMYDDSSMARHGQMVAPMGPQDGAMSAWRGGPTRPPGFSESSSYETREHYERKVQRVKKTRRERDSKGKKVNHSFIPHSTTICSRCQFRSSAVIDHQFRAPAANCQSSNR